MTGPTASSRPARRAWIGVALLLVAGLGGTALLVRAIEERAWRELEETFDAGVGEYREFYATVSEPYSMEHEILHGADVAMEHLRDWAVSVPVGGERLVEERGAVRWRRSRTLALGRMPPRGGLQARATLTLIAERTGFARTLRAEARMIEKEHGADARWPEALARIFEGSDVEFEVVAGPD